MKNLVLSILLIGFAAIGWSQSSQSMMEVKLSEVTVSPLIHNSYFNTVSKGLASPSVLSLENKVARFDITRSPVFNQSMDLFEVTFEQPNGVILATFDKEGNIKKSLERFNDITFPQDIRDEIYNKYPGWTTDSNSYQVSYHDTRGTKRIYKVSLSKDNQLKRLKIAK